MECCMLTFFKPPLSTLFPFLSLPFFPQAWGLGMDRCVLTEFKANKAAEAFYRKLGYRPDATTPSASACGYVILSKKRPAANK